MTMGLRSKLDLPRGDQGGAKAISLFEVRLGAGNSGSAFNGGELRGSCPARRFRGNAHIGTPASPPDRALTRRSDHLPLADDVPPARTDQRMMAVIVRTEIGQHERGGLLPNPPLQPDEHLGRYAPSVVRR